MKGRIQMWIHIYFKSWIRIRIKMMRIHNTESKWNCHCKKLRNSHQEISASSHKNPETEQILCRCGRTVLIMPQNLATNIRNIQTFF
jgi:hypothetical protein